MKNNIFKGILVAVLISVTISVFALSGTILKPKADNRSIKKDVVAIEIVIDDIDKMNVPVYEYVPKVITEGKWGTGSGEFGGQLKGFCQEPFSFTVNHNGNIYILDQFNKCIQKYNRNGKYIHEIKIREDCDIAVDLSENIYLNYANKIYKHEKKWEIICHLSKIILEYNKYGKLLSKIKVLAHEEKEYFTFKYYATGPKGNIDRLKTYKKGVEVIKYEKKPHI
ncbi:hypothetical protein J7L48_10175 [bacterium]|nr:hypothetical protein [bacterium]